MLHSKQLVLNQHPHTSQHEHRHAGALPGAPGALQPGDAGPLQPAGINSALFAFSGVVGHGGAEPGVQKKEKKTAPSAEFARIVEDFANTAPFANSRSEV